MRSLHISSFVGVLFVVIFPTKLVSCQSEFGSIFCLRKKKRFFSGILHSGHWPGTTGSAAGKVGSQTGVPGAAAGKVGSQSGVPGAAARLPKTSQSSEDPGTLPGPPGAAAGKIGIQPGVPGAATGLRRGTRAQELPAHSSVHWVLLPGYLVCGPVPPGQLPGCSTFCPFFFPNGYISAWAINSPSSTLG